MISSSLITLLLVSKVKAGTADDRYFEYYSGHKVYTKYDHFDGRDITVDIIIAILVIIALLACFFLRKLPDDR